MNGLGITLRDVIEATIALAVIAAQVKSLRASLRSQGKRIGAVEKELIAIKARKELN